MTWARQNDARGATHALETCHCTESVSQEPRHCCVALRHSASASQGARHIWWTNAWLEPVAAATLSAENWRLQQDGSYATWQEPHGCVAATLILIRFHASMNDATVASAAGGAATRGNSSDKRRNAHAESERRDSAAAAANVRIEGRASTSD